MEEFKQIFNYLLKKFLKAKIIAIALVILVIGFFVWNNFNFITALNLNFTISPDKKEHESKKEGLFRQFPSPLQTNFLKSYSFPLNHFFPKKLPSNFTPLGGARGDSNRPLIYTNNICV